MNPIEISPPEQLMKYIVGKWISKPLYVAAELGIADMFDEKPLSIEELAKRSQSYAPYLYRMMRALASVGIFSELQNKQFKITPMAEFLKTGAMRSLVLMFNSDWSDEAWGSFLESIKTGHTAFEIAHNMPVTEWLEENPHAAEIFNEANAIKAASSHSVILSDYDFKGINSITDVGGGIGVLMLDILKANPLMNGAVADIPSVIKLTKEKIRLHGFEDRCQAVECDFFKNIPSNSDLYILSNILHDWTDEKCKIILQNLYNAMSVESKLLVVEMIIPQGNEPAIAKLLDLEMMVTTGGSERTESEFVDLFSSSGFKISKILRNNNEVCLIEVIKASEN